MAYLDTISSIPDWRPAGAPSGYDVDADTLAQYGTQVVPQLWRTMPGELVGIFDEAAGALAGVSGELGQAIGQAFEGVAGAMEAVPFIGSIIGASVNVIADGVGQIKAWDELVSAVDHDGRPVRELGGQDALRANPLRMAHATIRDPLYPDKSSAGWRAKPCFVSPSLTQAVWDPSFPGGIGYCGTGARIQKTLPNKGSMFDNDFKPRAGEGGNLCKQAVAISGVCFPAWSPQLKNRPSPVYEISGGPPLLTETALRCQVLALSVPRANLAIDARPLEGIAKRSAWWVRRLGWSSYAKGPDGTTHKVAGKPPRTGTQNPPAYYIDGARLVRSQWAYDYPAPETLVVETQGGDYPVSWIVATSYALQGFFGFRRRLLSQGIPAGMMASEIPEPLVRSAIANASPKHKLTGDLSELVARDRRRKLAIGATGAAALVGAGYWYFTRK